MTIGDSLTRATSSYNYVEILQDRFGDEGYQFINAGIDAELAYNVVQRLDEIVACDPDYVTVLIGANDVMASFSQESAEWYVSSMKLPQQPTQEWYEENLKTIVRRLQKDTDAQIVLLTLTLFGEDLDSPANADMADYSQTVIEVAEERGVTYLPLHETLREYIAAQGNNPQPQCAKDDFQAFEKAIGSSVLKHSLLFKPWDRISEDEGFYLVTDCVHLNRTGATKITDLISDWLRAAD